MDILISCVTAFLGSLGFSLIFNLRGRQIVLTSLGGLIAWAVYLLVDYLLVKTSYFIPCFAGTVAGVTYISILSGHTKAPTMVLQLPALVPLIPGSSLYYTLYYFCQSDWQQMFSYAAKTFAFVFGITMGMTFVKLAKEFLENIRKKRCKAQPQ